MPHTPGHRSLTARLAPRGVGPIHPCRPSSQLPRSPHLASPHSMNGVLLHLPLLIPRKPHRSEAHTWLRDPVERYTPPTCTGLTGAVAVDLWRGGAPQPLLSSPRATGLTSANPAKPPSHDCPSSSTCPPRFLRRLGFSTGRRGRGCRWARAASRLRTHRRRAPCRSCGGGSSRPRPRTATGPTTTTTTRGRSRPRPPRRRPRSPRSGPGPSGRAWTAAAGWSGACAPPGGCCSSSTTRCRPRSRSMSRRPSRGRSRTRPGSSCRRRGCELSTPSSSSPASSPGGSSYGRGTIAPRGSFANGYGAAHLVTYIRGAFFSFYLFIFVSGITVVVVNLIVSSN